MKRSLTLLVTLVAALSSLAALPAATNYASAKHKTAPVIGAEGYALGAYLGQPTGLSLRMGLGHTQSFELKAAWDLSSSASIHLEGSWLAEFPDLLVIEGEHFIPYLGGGAFAELGASTNIGLRMPLGLTYRFRSAPIELAAEIGLGMRIYPSTTVQGSGGLAIRWRF